METRTPRKRLATKHIALTMERYIKALLAANGRAIIPQFGCLLKPSEEPTTLTFNPWLNFDDGKLASVISQAERESEEEARRDISRAVDSYNNTLMDGNTVTLEGIGSFKKDEEGRVEFTLSQDYRPEEGEISLGLGMGEAIDFAEPTRTEPEEKEVVKEEEVENNNEEELTDTPTPTYAEEEKSRKPLIIIIILLLLLLIIGLLLFVFFKDNAAYRFVSKYFTKPAVEQVVAPVDTVAASPDTLAIEVTEPKPAEQKAQAKPEKPAPTVARALDKRYNVVVGSYKEEAVAIKRVEELRGKGFGDAFVGIRKDYFVAVIKDFTSITQAEAYQEEIVDGPYHIESWITNSGENGK